MRLHLRLLASLTLASLFFTACAADPVRPRPPASLPARPVPVAVAPPELPPNGVVPFGTKVETTSYRIELTASHPCEGTDGLGHIYGEENGILAVEIAIEGKRDKPLLHRIVGVKDPDGRLYTYRISGPFGSCAPKLEGEPIRDGEKLRGWLFFLVPKGAAPTELDLAMQLAFGDEQDLRLGLPPAAARHP